MGVHVSVPSSVLMRSAAERHSRVYARYSGISRRDGVSNVAQAGLPARYAVSAARRRRDLLARGFIVTATGIALEPETQRPRTDPGTLESERAGIYLAGVIVAGMHTNEIFIENGRFHGELIAQSIASKIMNR